METNIIQARALLLEILQSQPQLLSLSTVDAQAGEAVAEFCDAFIRKYCVLYPDQDQSPP